MEENTQTKKGLSTGAKRVIASIGILALLGTAVVGTKHVGNAIETHKEISRVESAITYFMDDDKLVKFPEYTLIDQNYDEDFCKGETLKEQLIANGAEYCIIDGEYYTEKGNEIAILTIKVTRKDVLDAGRYEIDGNVVYMAPEGYVLEGGKCYKTVTETITKVVPKRDDNDYSSIMIEGAESASTESIEILPTKKYSQLAGYDLICDVADGAELENGYCQAELILKKRR